MTRDLLTPIVRSGVVRDLANGLVYRKQILPVKAISYQGRTLDFNEKYIEDLIRAFNDAAYDQVPFTLATDDNRHSADPERIRGEVTAVSLAQPGEDPGLYATIAFPNAKAAQAVMMTNLKLGVSCRIEENRTKDGRTYPKALAHVCGTVDPRATKMSPWRKVDLSNDDGHQVVDLSNGTYTEGTVGDKKTTTATEDEIDFSDWTDDELRDLAVSLGVDPDELDADGGDEDDDDADTDENDADADDANADDPEHAGASLSNGKGQVVDLAARQRANAANERADEALSILAQTAWDQRKLNLQNAGVPPAAIDLCEKVFNRPHKLVIDLSSAEDGSDQFDVQEFASGMLDCLKGYVDLANETGHGGQFRESTDDKDPDEDVLNQWDAEYGS